MYDYDISMPAELPWLIEDGRRWPWPALVPSTPPPAQSSNVLPPPPNGKLKWHLYPGNHTNMTAKGMLRDISLAEDVQ
jgi:hypothetical protein